MSSMLLLLWAGTGRCLIGQMRRMGLEREEVESEGDAHLSSTEETPLLPEARPEHLDPKVRGQLDFQGEDPSQTFGNTGPTALIIRSSIEPSIQVLVVLLVSDTKSHSDRNTTLRRFPLRMARMPTVKHRQSDSRPSL